MNMKKLRVIKLILAITVLIATLLPAQAAGSFQAMVTSGSMKVYQKNAPYQYLGSLPKGTTVTVSAYSGEKALISYNGKTGIARASDMTAIEPAAQAKDSAEAALEATEAKETATADEIAQAKSMVTNRATRVYSKPSRKASYINVQAGTTLSLLSVKGSVARVAKGSIVGYMPAGHLSDPDSTDGAQQPQTPATDSGITRYDRVPVATTARARIYARPSTSSASVTVEKGTRMVLLAAKGNCAMVERDGRQGYVNKSLLTTDVDSTTAPESSATTADIRNGGSISFSGSNEEVIYQFLTRVAGYNTAAACGIMANIKYESGYKPTTGGDGGSSYGIVQWHAARKTRLINWCRENSYDYTTLKGQLYFLQYELKHFYPAVHNKLKAVENSENGAYNAGYFFCYDYEAPSNRASRSVTRGNYAKSTLWKRYKV